MANGINIVRYTTFSIGGVAKNFGNVVNRNPKNAGVNTK
jgi:hypothetical protein